ncbi:MAG: polysaccharide deacetylase family protein [Bacteroidales bacterium]|nr:polysaccharide deacetylase family protein [Bacteroidales bacterium]
MIYVYCPKITARIEYVTSLLFGSILDTEWKLTANETDFTAYTGPKIVYAPNNKDKTALHIPANGFLSERGVHYFLPEIQWKNKLPLLFPVSENKDTGFDAFSAAFYLVSRYEEYLPHKKDKYGRFEAKESFAFKNNFLQIPVVNHYAMLIRQGLEKKFRNFRIAPTAFTFIPTYDIDVAYAFRGRGFLRHLLGAARSLWKLDLEEFAGRFKVLTGNMQDPFDSYDYQLRLYKESGIKACYFFLCGNYGHYDKNIPFYSKAFFLLVKMLGDYACVGLHPSFASNDDEKLLAVEKERLGKILNREIMFSRQHYLKLNLPKTYHQLLKENILYDFSMGYASQPGFRASICSPFPFYDLEAETATPLTIIPLAVMDGTFKHYLKLTPKEALNIITGICAEVEQLGGTFTTLWHNDSLCDCNEWKGWRELYGQVYSMASAKHQKKYDPLYTT